MLWSWWPRADARCLPIFCSTNPTLPTLPMLPAGHHTSPAFLSQVIFPKKLSQWHSSFSQYQNTWTNWAKHLPGVVVLITTRVNKLMTDLAVAIYDTGNAIISIIMLLVRFLSPHLAPLFLGISWPHSKGQALFQENAWRETQWVTGTKLKPTEIKQLVPKHGRHTVLPWELSHEIIFPTALLFPSHRCLTFGSSPLPAEEKKSVTVPCPPRSGSWY